MSCHAHILLVTILQIIKLLNLYTPADDYEEKVPITFIHKIQATLQERAEAQANQFAGEQQVCYPAIPFNDCRNSCSIQSFTCS